MLDRNELKKVILSEFHVKPYLGHPRYQKTLTTLKKFNYWSNLKKDVAEFVVRCFDCQKVKEGCKHPGGLLKLILILEWKWGVISFQFIKNFPSTVRQHDSIMVFVDMLTKVEHFILVRYTFLASNVA